MTGIIIALIVTYGTPSGEREHLQEVMPSLEVCIKTADELLRAAGPEMIQYGVSAACFMKMTGEPS